MVGQSRHSECRTLYSSSVIVEIEQNILTKYGHYWQDLWIGPHFSIGCSFQIFSRGKSSVTTMKLAIALSSLILLPASCAKDDLLKATATGVEMVATANSLATEAAENILAAGGTAVDAMIAVQTVLGLVEPEASGIAGGALLVYYDATSGNLTTLDARGKAPSQATEERFIDPLTGISTDFFDAWQSGLSVGVPGVPRMMEHMHDRYGSLPWVDLFDQAKTLALEGFSLTERTSDQVNELLGYNGDLPCDERLFFRDPAAFEYFANPDCTAKPAGTFVTNSAYADMMDLLASGGADAFYTGPVADEIVAKVANDLNPTGDPTISLQDLADYEVIERQPVCKSYRGNYNVCGMGPPSSGAIAVGQILGILENYDFAALGFGPGPQDVDTVHLFTQAARLAFADRNQYVGDADFITVPVEGLLDEGYLKERAGLIDMAMDMGTALPGNPPGTYDTSAPQTTSSEFGASHLSIVDQYGNAISMTTTVNSYFGSGLMVRGFLLNNQITDFSFEPVDALGTPIANRVQPNKRPRSSMSPTIVLNKDGALAYLTGAPGGSRIIGYTAQSLVSMLDFGLDPQEAVNVPHYQNSNSDTEIEVPQPGITDDYDYYALFVALSARGHSVQPRGFETSGLSIVQVLADGFLGGADPRRDGSVGGRLATPATPAPTPVPSAVPSALPSSVPSAVPSIAPTGGTPAFSPAPTPSRTGDAATSSFNSAAAVISILGSAILNNIIVA
jgi:gamma-glutamyltranspeptidase/glutathione hydrolase